MSNLTITSTVAGGILPIANGGTGHTFAIAALNGLLPNQTGNAGNVLGTDGTNANWVVPPSQGPAGPTGPAGADGSVGPMGPAGPGVILSGTYANIPVAGTVGRVYVATDSPFDWYDTGSAWAPYGPRQYVNPANIPNVNNFTWVNQQTASTSPNYGGIYLESATGPSIGLQILEMPWTPGSTLIAYGCITGQLRQNNGWCAGFTMRAPASTNNVLLNGVYNNNGIYSGAFLFSSPTSGYGNTSTASDYSVRVTGQYNWYKVADDGINLTFSVSVDGITYEILYSISNTYQLGVLPTTIGFCVGWGVPLAFHLLSWQII